MGRAGKIVATEFYDPNTGIQEKQVKTSTYNVPDEPPYIKLYIADILYLSDMPRRYEALTLALLKRVSYAGDDQGLCVTINKFTKDSICKEIDWKNPVSVDNGIQVLMKGNILYRVARGTYRFNPFLFGRGNWADIKALRMEINYSDIKGRTFVSSIKYKQNEQEFWGDMNKDEGENE